MRPHGSQEELEKRRRRAIELLKEGETSLSAVARSVGASKSSVFRWYQEYQEGGSKALRSKAIPGRPPRLSQKEKEKLAELLLSGPLEAGYQTDLWTLKRIAQTIHKHFGTGITPIICGGCFRPWGGVARNQSGGLYKGTRKTLCIGGFIGGSV